MTSMMWPGAWPLLKLQGSQVYCSHLTGQCACGETHVEDEFTYLRRSREFMRFGETLPKECVFSRHTKKPAKAQRRVKILVATTSSIVETLDFIAIEDGIDRIDVIRQAFAFYINEWEKRTGKYLPDHIDAPPAHRPKKHAKIKGAD